VIWAYACAPDLIEEQRFYRFDPIIWKKSEPAERYYMAKFLVDHNKLIGKTKAAVTDLLGKADVDGSLLLYNLGPERGALFKVDDDWLDVRFDDSHSPVVVGRTFIRPD
jgi:hypothetical protein